MVIAGLVAGAVHLSFHDGFARRLRKGVGVALATAGLFAVTNYVLTPKGPIELRWLHAEAEALADARAANRPLLVDFMASWCLPCKEFELKVFSDPEVAAEMQSFTLLKVDLTREDDDPALGVDQEEVRRRHPARDPPGRPRRSAARQDRRADVRAGLPRAAAGDPQSSRQPGRRGGAPSGGVARRALKPRYSRQVLLNCRRYSAAVSRASYTTPSAYAVCPMA